jgi:hypothetical protein
LEKLWGWRLSRAVPALSFVGEGRVLRASLLEYLKDLKREIERAWRVIEWLRGFYDPKAPTADSTKELEARRLLRTLEALSGRLLVVVGKSPSDGNPPPGASGSVVEMADAFEAHLIRARREFVAVAAADGKSGKRTDRHVLMSCQRAHELGWHGSLDQWEELLTVQPPPPRDPDAF